MVKISFVILLLAGLIFMLTLPVISAVECQDRTDIEDIPCMVVTPIVDNDECNATIYEVSSGEWIDSINMTPVGDGTFNFSFHLVNLTIYSIVLCDNSTASIDIGHWDEDYNDKWIYFYGVSLGLGVVLLIFGFKTESNLMMFLGGLLFISFGIVFISEGYPTFEQNSVLGLSIILLSLSSGSYIILRSGLGMIGGDL